MSAKTIGKEAAQAASPRQWINLVVVYLLIPLILLICGGDLGWRQAWFYSLLIVVAGLGGRIWAEQRHPGLTAERQDIENFQNAKTWDKVLAPLMAVSIGYPMVVVAGLDHRYSWSSEFPLWLIMLGFVLISLGYAFAGNIIALFGIVLALGSVWTLIPATVASIIAVIRTVLEDQTLQEELPGYRDYARRVRYRLIPWIY